MKEAQDYPLTIETIADARALKSGSQRHETPCGNGSIVWHLWGTGAPVLLLHGGSGSWTHWVRNIGALVNDGYQVLAPDLPGFGDSAAPPDGRDADVMPHWLETGLEQLIGTTPCHLVGFSFGAMVGTLLAAATPSRAAGLIMVGAPALSTIPMPRLGLRAWDHLPAGVERTAIHRHNLAALMLARDESINELALTLHGANLERDRLKRRRLALTDIVVRTLPDVRCSVAGIWGAKDAVYREREHTIEPALAGASGFQGLALLPQAGHWAQYEDAQLFNQLLAAALGKQNNPSLS